MILFGIRLPRMVRQPTLQLSVLPNITLKAVSTMFTYTEQVLLPIL